MKDDLNALIEAIAAVARSGDQILVMSNGGFGGIHEKLLKRLHITCRFLVVFLDNGIQSGKASHGSSGLFLKNAIQDFLRETGITDMCASTTIAA